MLALYSSLLTLAVSTIAWPTGVGLAAGLVVGGGLAFGLIDRVFRAQGRNPQRGLVRRLSTVCCLLWGLTLPLGAMAAGVVWGVGFGVGTLVDGPVSVTVREAVHSTVVTANGLAAGLRERLPLGKRLSERELLTIVQAAPAWISGALDEERVGALWQKATGAPMPPQLASALRQEFQALTSHHVEWLQPVVAGLRARAQGTAGNWPTVREALEATVAPPVFHQASRSIRATTRRHALVLGGGVILLAALLAVGLKVAWRSPDPAAMVAAAGSAAPRPTLVPDETGLG
jgi:hypothetical protein